MKKEITIPEAAITIETKFVAYSISQGTRMDGTYSPEFDSYGEAETWIATQIKNFPNGPLKFRIEAFHGRFDAQ